MLTYIKLVAAWLIVDDSDDI